MALEVALPCYSALDVGSSNARFNESRNGAALLPTLRRSKLLPASYFCARRSVVRPTMASGEVGWCRAAPPFFPLFQPESKEDASISFSSKSCTWRTPSEADCLASSRSFSAQTNCAFRGSIVAHILSSSVCRSCAAIFWASACAVNWATKACSRCLALAWAASSFCCISRRSWASSSRKAR
jgi:hypothetical protein